MTFGRTNVREIPEKETFDLYLELNSMAKVVANYARRGLMSSRTGSYYNIGSVRLTCYRYIIEHPEYCREKLIARGEEWAEKDDKWFDYIVRKAWVLKNSSPKKFCEWMHDTKLGITDFRYVYPDFYAGLVEMWNRRFPDEKETLKEL